MDQFENELFSQRLEELRKERNALIEEKKKKEELKEQKIAERAKRYLKQGLPYAEKIFAWVRNFKNSDIGKQILSLIEPNDNGVKIILLEAFRQGRVEMRDDNGLIWYQGFNYRGDFINSAADRPETLALWVAPRNLSALCLCLESTPHLIYEDKIRQITVQLNRLKDNICELEKVLKHLS